MKPKAVILAVMVAGLTGGLPVLEAGTDKVFDVPAKGAEFDILIETRDAQHTQEIMDALREAGYPPRAV